MWEYTSSSVCKLLQDYCLEWRDISVTDNAMYLGFVVGIRAHLYSWDRPLAKLKSRVNVIRQSKVGLAGALFLYNVMALSVMAHVAQLCEPSDAIIDQVNKICVKIIPAPHNWARADFLSRIQLFLPFRTAIYDFATWCLSVRIRVIYKTLRTWPSLAVRLASLPEIAEAASPHAVLRRTHEYCLRTSFIDKSGQFSNEHVNKSFSNLDCKVPSLQTSIYRVLFNQSVPYHVFEAFATRMNRWSFPPIFHKQRPVLPDVILDIQRSASMLCHEGIPSRVLSAIF